MFCRVPDGYDPPRVVRPHDVIERKKAKDRIRKANERLKNQTWKEV